VFVSVPGGGPGRGGGGGGEGVSRIFVPLFGDQHGLIFQTVAGNQD